MVYRLKYNKIEDFNQGIIKSNKQRIQLVPHKKNVVSLCEKSCYIKKDEVLVPSHMKQGN